MAAPRSPVGVRARRLHGHVCPQPVEVRFGQPVRPGELAADGAGAALLRDRVVDLYDQGPAVAPSFAWGVAEAVSWPVLAEMYLVLWVACHPKRIMPATLALVVGSVVGVVLHASLVRHGVEPALPLTTPRMAATSAVQLVREGPLAIWHQPLNGIPVKVYAAQAGAGGTNLAELALWTALARGARILTVALVLRTLARRLLPTLRRLYGPYLLGAALVCAVVLHSVIARWS